MIEHFDTKPDNFCIFAECKIDRLWRGVSGVDYLLEIRRARLFERGFKGMELDKLKCDLALGVRIP